MLKPLRFLLSTVQTLCPFKSIGLVPLDRSVVLLEELLKVVGQLVSPRRSVHKSVDCLPAQVLQGRQAAGQRFDELQRDLLSSRVDEVESVPFALRHVTVD